MPRETGTQAVERAIAILKVFTREDSELGLIEISRRLDLHKSTVHRLVGALEREGLVTRSGDSGRYRLGLGLITLAGLVDANEELRRIAWPWLHKLAIMTEETVSLAVLDGLEAVNVERVLPQGRRMVSYAWLGHRAPVNAVSTGKVLLAFQPRKEWQSLLQGPLPAPTSRTISDPEKLTAELEKVREQGYATGIGELEEGLSAVAAPVHDRRVEVVAAVAISGPSSRISESEIEGLAKNVVAVAECISRELGWSKSVPDRANPV